MDFSLTKEIYTTVFNRSRRKLSHQHACFGKLVNNQTRYTIYGLFVKELGFKLYVTPWSQPYYTPVNNWSEYYSILNKIMDSIAEPLNLRRWNLRNIGGRKLSSELRKHFYGPSKIKEVLRLQQ